MFDVRRMEPEDADALGEVMWSAIHEGQSQYTQAQRMAWLEVSPRGHLWLTRLSAQDVWVAEEDGQLIGFVTLAQGGYVDLAFVRAQAQGRGVFAALLAALERAARGQNLPRLWTHASLMAQPAFARAGFHVIRHETAERAGQCLDRAEMEKRLT